VATPDFAFRRLEKFRFGVVADNVCSNAYEYRYGTADAEAMCAMDMSAVRIPVDVSEVVLGLPCSYATGLSDSGRVAHGFKKLDAAVELFNDHGLAVEIASFVSNAVVAQGTQSVEYALTSANIALAQRYVPEYPYDMLFLGLYNEPRMTADEWNDFAPRLAANTRSVARNTTFLIGPIGFNKTANLPAFHTLTDPNIIYVMHHYDPARLTNQGQPGVKPNPDYHYPRPVPGGDPTEMSRAKMLAIIDQGINWAAANNVPFIMEEYGCTNKVADAASRDAWVRDVSQYADSRGLGRLWWSWSSREFGINPHGKGLDTHLQSLMTEWPTLRDDGTNVQDR
jgi:hypothetical protein